MSGDAHDCDGTRNNNNISFRGRSMINNTRTSRLLMLFIVALLIFLQVGTMLWTMTWTISSNCDITQQQQQQHDGTSTLRTSFQTMSNSNIRMKAGPSQQQDEDKDEENVLSACALVMDKFHRINEAYRQGEKTTNANNNNTYSSSLPVINYALYPGQGFGRLIDHAIFYGLMALALDRPVALYLADRDPYYTWRSYIATGSYDWEMRGPLLEYQEEIQKAILLLQSEKSSEWTLETAQNYHHHHHQYDYDANKTNNNATTKTTTAAFTNTPRLHLLHRPARWPEKSLAKLFWNRIQPWHAAAAAAATANNDSLTTTMANHESFVSPDAAILAPNWGSVWFPALSMPGIIQGCPLDRLKCQMQNAMFAPTPRTLHLHQQRLAKVLPLSETNPYYYYGSIHIRTYMLKMGNRGEVKMQKLYTTLVSCLQHVSEQLLLLDEPKNINAWWILSDDVDLAISLSSNITDFRLYNAYDADQGHADFVLNNKHSATPQVARGVYGQRGMAPSVLDWTVLHQSHVALVTEGTSFGGTGARGNGKFKRNVPRQACSYLEVYY